jgi:hypothetical protein
MKANASRFTLAAAYAIAVGVDILEIGLTPLFSEGIASPLNDVLDVIAAALLTILVGWHFVFMPSFLLKLVPVVEIAPTWTIAVVIATRSQWMTKKNASQPTSVNSQPPVIPSQNPSEKPPKMLP